MIEGFLEGLDAYQARGWVYDPDSPGRVLQIEIWKHDVLIGQARADLFRSDLALAGIGDGRHAFIFNMHTPLSQIDRSAVIAKVITEHGPITLTRLAEKLDREVVSYNQFDFEGLAVDTSHAPVFVLGAARSGTSAMAQALLKVGYDGHQEGHLFDLLASWSVTLNKFLDLNADDLQGGRDTMLARFSQDYLSQSLDEIFVKAARRAYPSGLWIDKTPNSNMVNLAPRLRRIWPNAAFIFMKRRFLENAASRARKFPGYDFAQNCREWQNTMQAWLDVRNGLKDVAIEIDQRDLTLVPESAAAEVARLLGWDPTKENIFSQALTYDWPERTSQRTHSTNSLDKMGWTEEQTNMYLTMCAPLMSEYNYSTDEGYYTIVNGDFALFP